VIESMGKVLRHLNLSQGKWRPGVSNCEIPSFN
jgi:hypothetical protein